MNAVNAYNRLNANVAGLKKASEKLSSGYRINRAGDDAAGLAISEKMRSQIKGLNQATRNAQDGINMIQTFEGAAQETHSILQRMKELATESANGTYDNPTDRAAIELEFGQLNDELNQIADTDYNGTIVLNGGVMADGLKAVDGEFNYKVAHDSMFDENGELKSKVGDDVTGFTGETAAQTITDNAPYGAKAANELWKALGLDASKVKDIDITFVKNDDGNWDAVMANDKDGNVLTNVNLKGISTETVKPADGVTGKGGFDVKWGKGDSETVLHNVFNDVTAKTGDHLTINFKNTDETTYAPDHAAVKESSITPDTTTAPNWNAGDMTFEVKLSDTITDGTMTDDLKKSLDDLKETEFQIAYTNGTPAITIKTAGSTAAYNVQLGTQNGNSIDVNDKDGNKLATITVKNTGGAPSVSFDSSSSAAITGAAPAATAGVSTGTYTAVGTGYFKSASATTLDATAYTGLALKDTSNAAVTLAKGDTVTINTANGNVTASSNASVDTGNCSGVTGSLKTSTAGSVTLVSDGAGGFYNASDLITAADMNVAGAIADGDTITFGMQTSANGNATFKVDVAEYHIADTSSVKCNSKAFGGKTEDLEKAVEGAGVTKANAFNNSTARMTYTDNITLQTGARTKDAVNFSFKYNMDNSADMGDLKANLDLSSRANGLNTANLSLANQKDANYAIDQIDKAINKTSLVRATFGSIQNRLEHKITNLTTTNENLTEAESSIRDTDMASEMMNYTKYNILQQAAQSMLAQANQQPQSVLQLLG